MILVSSCLAGLQVRYNGTHSLDLKISKLIVENKAIPVCPELLGGFSTPREPAEIIGGNGDDVLDGKPNESFILSFKGGVFLNAFYYV